MEYCHSHDVAYESSDCPACDLDIRDKELSDANSTIDSLEDEVNRLESKIADLEAEDSE